MNPALPWKPGRVACVGDSITEGAGAEPGRSYPTQLQEMLGPAWEVGNFGVSGRTLLRKGDFPCWNEPALAAAQAFSPQFVILKLGTNDTKPQNWAHRAEFPGDSRDVVRLFQALPGRPRVFNRAFKSRPSEKLVTTFSALFAESEPTSGLAGEWSNGSRGSHRVIHTRALLR